MQTFKSLYRAGIGLICLIPLVVSATVAPPHNELLGTFIFQRFSPTELLITAYVEKAHFTLALKTEGNCSRQEMMEVCGSQYILDHFNIHINEKEMQPQFQGLNIDRESITLSYSLQLSAEELSSIKIQSDYMLDYNSHAISRVVFDLDGSTRSYDLRKNKKSIIAKF